LAASKKLSRKPRANKLERPGKMAMTIHCDIVSAEEEIFSGLIEMIVASGEIGELGVKIGRAHV
jgi:hypothetical protein